MWISTLSTIVSVLVVLILNVNHVQGMPRRTFRFRSKGSSSLPPFLTISPPRLTSPPKFHSDFDLPPFLMPSGPAHSMNMPSFERPSQSYGPPPSQSYGPPPSQSYGPPPSQSYGPPPSQSYGTPPSQSYGTPPSQSYGTPPSQSYGPPPSQSYGTPAAEYRPPSTIPVKPMIHKHIYVHIPPPEPETPLTRSPLTTVAPQKHYRIVFIKAPTIQPPKLPTIPVQPQDEEKTLVYVLVRKPEELPELVLPKPASTAPSKPEVYFIRYQAQKDSNDGPYPPSSYSSTSSSATLGPPLSVFGMKNKSIPK